MDTLVLLIPTFPLIAVLLNGLLGQRYSTDLAHKLGWGSVGLSFLCSIAVFADQLGSGRAYEVVAYRWIFGGDLTINLAFLIDSLTCIMLLVVTVWNETCAAARLRAANAWGCCAVTSVSTRSCSITDLTNPWTNHPSLPGLTIIGWDASCAILDSAESATITWDLYTLMASFTRTLANGLVSVMFDPTRRMAFALVMSTESFVMRPKLRARRAARTKFICP